MITGLIASFIIFVLMSYVTFNELRDISDGDRPMLNRIISRVMFFTGMTVATLAFIVMSFVSLWLGIASVLFIAVLAFFD